MIYTSIAFYEEVEPIITLNLYRLIDTSLKKEIIGKTFFMKGKEDLYLIQLWNKLSLTFLATLFRFKSAIYINYD